MRLNNFETFSLELNHSYTKQLQMANSYFSVGSTILITDRSVNGGLASQVESNSQVKSVGYIKLLFSLC